MLAQHHDDLWTSRCLLDMGGVSISRTMVVVRMPDGGLWLHSPNEPTGELREALGRLGNVAWLVAPNCFHHRWLEQWQSAYPSAKLLGAPGLDAKRSDLQFEGMLDAPSPGPWQGVFEQIETRGARRFNEVAFFHLPSRTLLLTDYVFNQGEASGLPRFSRFMFRLLGATDRFGPSRLFRMLSDDRQAIKQSVEEMLDRWPVERVTMSHGEPVSDDAAARLRAAFERF